MKACGGERGPSAPDAPETDYGRSKLHGERAIEALLDGSETAFQNIRLPLMYSSNVTNNFSRLVSRKPWLASTASIFQANRSAATYQHTGLFGVLTFERRPRTHRIHL